MSRIARPGYFRLFYSWKTFSQIALLAAFAFLFCFLCGQRGFFPLDQSIVFDGAYRLRSGQVPFRDFVAPHSLLVLYYQALVFCLLGTNYFAYLIGAAFLNMLAVLFAARILVILFPDRRMSALIAAAITSVWFYSPFGTPFGEQSAFLLGMIAIDLLLSALVETDDAHPTAHMWRIAGCGVLAGLAFYCKQNVALFLLPFFILTPVIVWFPDWRRILCILAALAGGLAAGLLVPLVLIAASGGWQNFLYFYILLPIATALRRLSSGRPWQEFQGASLWIAVVVIVCAGLLSIRRHLAIRFRALFAARTRFLRESVAAWLALYCLLLSHVLRRSMLNSPTMADLYIGIVIGLVCALAIEREASTHSGHKKIFLAFVAVVFVFGSYLSWQRKVHESVKNSAFSETLSVAGLESLRWGIPTQIQDGDSSDEEAKINVSAETITDLVQFLKSDDRNFFVFPDFTFLYAVTQKVSPQPILFFHRGLTYPPEYDAAVDNWIVESLIANQVSIVVLEQKSFFGTARRLKDFPLLERFLSANFVEDRVIGPFKILALRTLEEPVG